MNSGFECDIEQVFDKFCTLTQTQMTGALRRGLRAGAKALQDQTKQNLTGVVHTRNNPHWYDGKRVFYNDEIEDAVRIGKIRGNGYGGNARDLSITVDVLGARNGEPGWSTSGTFVARFIEKGTKERFANHYRDRKHQLKTLKKPKRLGKITGRRYFKAAQGQILPTIESIYIKSIDEAINKINNS